MAKSVEMYVLACEKGDLLACKNVSNYYIRTHDYIFALPFLEKMCDKKQKDGCRDLGYIHFMYYMTNKEYKQKHLDI